MIKNNINIFTTVLFVALLSSSAWGQSAKKMMNKGDEAMQNHRYASAVHFYSLVLNKMEEGEDPNVYPYQVGVPEKAPEVNEDGTIDPPKNPSEKEVRLIHKLGEAYLSNHDYPNAKKWLETAVEHPSEEFPYSLYYLGEAYMQNDMYDEAIETFEKYQEQDGNPESKFYKLATDKMASCQFAKNPQNTDDQIQLDILDSLMNTGSASYAASYMPDGKILFSSARLDSANESIENNWNYYELDLYYSQPSADGKEFKHINDFPVQINSKVFHDGSASMSPDGRTLFFTRADINDLNNTQIYVCRRFNNQWMQPFALDSNVNMKGFMSKDPYISKDGKTLYFASNRPGGSGGYDIWYTTVDEGGNTTPPKNMGTKINTPGNDESPFLHDASNVFYFSSEGHIGFGGKDIFRSKWNPDVDWWGPAENVGAPINSSRDETHYIINDLQTTGYVTSDREKCSSCSVDSLDQNQGFCNRLYLVSKPEMVITISGLAINSETDELLPNTNIKIVDYTYQMEELEIQTNEDGYYELELPANVELFMKATKTDFFADAHTQTTMGITKTTALTQDFFLRPIPKGEIAIEGIEYDFDSANLREKSKEILDELYDFLTLNSNIKIEIRSHTDQRGNDDYNLRLSDARAKSVVDYLIEKGISKDRLISKGYGETEPAEVDFYENDEMVTLTEEFIKNLPTKEDKEKAHQRNRRTAFKVLDQNME